MASKCISKLAQLRPPSVSLNLFDQCLQVHLQLARSQPPFVSLNSHDYVLQVRTIIASKSIFKLAWWPPPIVSPNSLDYSLQTRSIMASQCISKFSQSQCGETVELEGRQPMMKTLPHLALYPKGIHEKEWFQFKERRKRVRWYDSLLRHDEPHKLHVSMNAWQEWMRIHTDWVDLRKLGKSAWDKELGKIVCIIRWCLSTPGSPKYILPFAESITVMPVSQYVYI